MTHTDSQPARSRFDWAIYADATFAGLAILIPIPLLDLLFEWFFRRRIPQAIARRHGRRLDRYTIHYLNRSQFSCTGCLLWPLELVYLLLKRMYRTILYFLTVKEASDKLSLYWHRAFLIDHMLRRGDLENEEQAQLAAQAMHGLLDELTTSPLTQLAGQIVDRGRHIFSTTWQWLRRREEDEVATDTRTQMANAWADFDLYFQGVAQRYEQRLGQVMAAHLEAVIRLERDSGPNEAAATAQQLRRKQEERDSARTSAPHGASASKQEPME